MDAQKLIKQLKKLLLPPKNFAVGVDVQNSQIRVAAISTRRGELLDIQAFNIDLSDPNVKPLYIIEKQLDKQELEEAILITSLEPQEVLVRPLEIKLGQGKNISSVFEFQAEPLLPYPIEEAMVEKVVVQEKKEATDLTVIAARTDHIQSHLGRMHAHSFEPEIISAEPVALANFARVFLPSNELQLIINIGENTTSCVFSLSGKLYMARSVSTGFRDLKEAFAKDFKISFEEAEKKLEKLSEITDLSPEKAPNFTEQLSRFRQETVRAVYSLNTAIEKTGLKTRAKSVTITGERDRLKGVSKLLTEALQLPPSTLTPPSATIPNEKLLSFAVPLGSALSFSLEGAEAVNFRKKSFAYPHPWKKLKKQLSYYAVFCLTITFLILYLGGAIVDRKLAKLQQNFGELLANEEYSLHQFEKEFSKKSSISTNLQDLSASQILNRALYLNKKLKATPELFPLCPGIPRASDVLAWLSTHPQVLFDEESNKTIQIERFSYSLIKRPDHNRPREKYQAQVELEFTAPTTTAARAFHDALIAPNPFINPKSEVKWSSSRGRWRTSFLLRDRTYYPSLSKGGS